MKVKYLKSAVLPKDFPAGDRPEVALAGRSNAGKSSFINAAVGQKIANVSQVPGKTKLLSFFDVGEHYRFVDMPGYGYASRSNDEISGWQTMIETYLSTRGNLAGLVLLMDLRRDWQQEEEQLASFMSAIGKPLLVALTKVDKCSRGEGIKHQARIKKVSGLENVFLISSTTKAGINELEDFIFEAWVKNRPKDDLL